MTAIERRPRMVDIETDTVSSVMAARTDSPDSTTSAADAGRSSDSSSMLADLGLRPRSVLVTLTTIAGLLTALGVVAAWFAPEAQWKYQLFELNTEANVPTWFSAVQLGFAALIAWWCAVAHRRADLGGVWSWRLVAAALLFVSADEVAQFHEQISYQVRVSLDTDGALRFAWVIPYGVAVLALAALLWGWWRSLPRTTRLQLAGAAVAFVVGALGLELIESAYESVRGKDFGLRALTVVEEALEMFAVAAVVGIFLRHLSQIIEARGARAAGTPSAPRPASD